MVTVEGYLHQADFLVEAGLLGGRHILGQERGRLPVRRQRGHQVVVGREVLLRWGRRGWGALHLSMSREWGGRLDPFPVHYTYLLYNRGAL